MVVPLLATKLYVPPVRPRLVSRSRLIEQVSSALHRKVTLICAPAGFGKTTLLSECAASCGLPFAWLALDRADNDTSRFLAYLIGALRGIDQGIGQAALNALKSPQTPRTESLLVGLINDLASVPAPFVLVLDDYHLIEAEAIHEVLTFLLDHQPPQMHLVLSTRTDPPLPIARLRGRGQVTELRQQDLRFTLDETAEFLNAAMDLGLSPADLAALASRTEGWIAGLQMAAVSMRGQEDPSAFVHAFAGSHRHVLDFLMEEVLKQQPPSIEAFLLQTAILDRLTGPLCDALLVGGELQPAAADAGPPDPASGQEVLEYLDRANLFVVPLDQERRWYRYHRLFADLLRKRLEQTQPDSAQDLHRRASIWFEEQGLVAEAIEHAISAGDHQHALCLIEGIAESAVMRSEVGTLQGWLEALPDELVRTRSLLCVYHAWALLLGGCRVEVAEARLQDAVDADPGGECAGEVLAVRALIASYQRQTDETIELSRRALELLPEDRLFFRSFIAGYLGYNTMYSGDLVAARQALEETVRLSRLAGNLLNEVLALCHLGDVAMFEGHFDEGEAFYKQALALAVDERGQREPIAGVALIGLGQLYTVRYRLKAAERYLQEGIDLVERWAKPAAIGGYLGLARIRRYRGDLGAALSAIETAERLAIRFDAMKDDDVYVAREMASLWLAQGDLDAVSEWVEASGLDGEVRIFLRDKDGSVPIPFNRMLGYVLTVRLRLAQDRPDEALEILGPLRQIVEGAGWSMYTTRLLILEALALHQKGSTPEALDALERALLWSEPERYTAFFVDGGAPMADLLRHAASRGIVPEFTSALLAHLSAAPSSPALPVPPTQVQPLVEPLSDRELDVLRLLATSLTTPEIAEDLYISVSTVRSHTKSIYSKLNVHRRWDAAERARELGLF